MIPTLLISAPDSPPADIRKSTVADIYDDMTRRYEAAVTSFCAAEEKTRQGLNMQGVHTSSKCHTSTLPVSCTG
jgi:hypothetical protein